MLFQYSEDTQDLSHDKIDDNQDEELLFAFT